MGHRAGRPRPSNLPAELTSFVGRRSELREVKNLLTTTRVLTLTGSGGAGKTRLALRAATEMARGFPDGAWLVGAGGANEGFILFQDVAKKKSLRDEKLPMHVHDFLLSPSGDTITAAGHNKVAVYKHG